jgi:hypothetical protein
MKHKVKLMFTLPWGRVIDSATGVQFKGNPDLYAQALMKAHQPSGALGLVDTTINNGKPEGTFWPRVKEVIVKRLKVEAAAKLGKNGAN